MSHHRTSRLTALATTVVVALGLGVAAAAPSPADETTPGRLLLMLDASGSMKKPDPSGLSKIEAAKKALTSVVGALPEDSQVGLRVYGATVDSNGKPTKAACADSQAVVPVGALDRPALTRAISRFRAVGETPIAYSLTKALADLGPTGKRNIVLVSDGEESCVPDPCPTVKKLVADGVDLQIDTVGFAVSAKARKQLQCIADAGRGTYYDAEDAGALATSLGKLSQRALRPFTVSGTPVVATETAETAPVLTPGQYTDTFAVGTAPRYYAVQRTAGSTIRLSLTARPPANPESYSTERLDVTVMTPEGKQCRNDNALRFDPGRRAEAVVSQIRVDGPEDASDTDPCHTATTLRVSVHRPKGVDQDVPVEVLYIEEPALRDATGLPATLEPTGVKALVAPASGAGETVVGGGGFSDALTLTPGTYRDTLLPAEQIFYRVRLDWGQRAALTVDAPEPGEKLTLGSTSYTGFAVDVYAPDRAVLTRTSGEPRNAGSLGPAGTSLQLTEYTPEVRWANRTAFGNGPYSFVQLRKASLAGYYYFAVGRTDEPDGADSAAPVDVRLRVAVEGSPTGAPQYAGAVAATGPSTTPSASPTPSASTTPVASGPARDKDDGSPWPIVAGGGLVALLGAGGVLYALRRGRGTGPTQPPGGSQA
ncbi:VWA domain-containing protein [Phycicoccus sp. HDW14]|uniref:vWA domain-containing protein n=1 Tax=Phycicoccus sp. HDW14 TaxID=2714941 RepID=UPI00140CD3FF|nr:VWA domain-containing protein [Phycicoccus sp. HDW14]QIM21504.1 VWA domain-containing protein [Phycicoccus sp. HDW14]